jgi:hypothetical protein
VVIINTNNKQNTMGSGTTRKQNDEVITNRPKSRRGSGDGEGGKRTQLLNEDMNTVCPPTFRVKLAFSKPIPESAYLHIENGDVIYSNQKVGSLTKSQTRIVSRCSAKGYRYLGKVINKDNNQYGVFTRTG